MVQKNGLPRANKVRVSEHSVHLVRGHPRSTFPEHSPAQAHTRTCLHTHPCFHSDRCAWPRRPPVRACSPTPSHTHTLCTPSGAHRAHTFANPLWLRPAGPPQTAVCSSDRAGSDPTHPVWLHRQRCPVGVRRRLSAPAAPSRESSGREGGYTEGKEAERRQRCQGSCSKVCVCGGEGSSMGAV